MQTNHGWLIIDLRSGGVDGYYYGHHVGDQVVGYGLEEMLRLRDDVAQLLGHDDVIVAKSFGPDCPAISDRAFLSIKHHRATGSSADGG